MTSSSQQHQTELTRKPDRGRQDRADLDVVLDAMPVGTLSTVVDGRPWVVPMLFCRDGDRLLLHGSTGAGALRHVAAGSPAALSVVHLDGIVVADSTFESSANYRSAVVYGSLSPIEGDEKDAGLRKLSDAILPGRTTEVRPSTGKELAATLAMSMPIVEGSWMVKTRSGPPSEPGDPNVWEGVVPLGLTVGPPEPAPWLSAGVPVPASVRALADGWPAR
ncbi:MAG: pyridoxamine 5'-phosphate oxidase family protein [Propionicimonas sp.]|uniref:pyridoxamine 5'-phosphate oxidase family protein n=1 Tax=Propionicimonas sp. TaxID=1955623 RepID=UPI003D14980F